MYCVVNKQQYIHILVEYKTTYLDFINEPLGSALYPRRLLGLGELLVTGPVVPTLAPHENMLATIMGAPLDPLHFVIGGCLRLLALRATPAVVTGIRGPLPRLGEPFGVEASAGTGVGALSSSARGGVGTFSPSSTTLLGGGVLAAS